MHIGERAWDIARKGKNQIMMVHLCHSKKLKSYPEDYYLIVSYGTLLGEQLEGQLCVLDEYAAHGLKGGSKVRSRISDK